MPINFRLTRAEIDYILADAAAATLVDGPLSAEHEPAPQAAVAPGDGALLCYTSGTTGRPKGAFLSHANLVASTLSWIDEMGATADDVWLSGQPLFHIGGINGMLPFLALGAKAVITPTTASIRRPRSAHGAPRRDDVHLRPDAVGPGDAPCPRRTRLRVAMWGAAPASRHTLESLARTYPGRRHRQCLRPDRDVRRDHAAQGRRTRRARWARSACRCATSNCGSSTTTCATSTPDEVGEIVYRGPFVMRGYWNNPEATAEAFAGGWFHSGDLATRDEEGYLRLVDRKKDMIVSGGENIYPAEVERVLREHPAVADVAVVGVPHPRWGETRWPSSVRRLVAKAS